jgi:hypothetical protein
MVADFVAMKAHAARGDAVRIRSLHAFLTELRRLGEAVIDDSKTLKEMVETHMDHSRQAVGHFERASSFFRELAGKAEFPETKEQFEAMAEWYATRAKVAKHTATKPMLTNYDTERRRLVEFVKSVRVLERTVEHDPSLLQKAPEGLKNLTFFEKYYQNLGKALRAHAKEMTDALKEQAGDEAASDEVPDAYKSGPVPATSPAEPPPSAPEQPRRARVVMASLALPFDGDTMASPLEAEPVATAAEASGDRRLLDCGVVLAAAVVLLGVACWVARPC